jgi:fructose-1,6-bisphosphatase I
MARKIITLGHFINSSQTKFEDATGEFSRLLGDIGLAAKVIHREVSRAGLVDILGATGEDNVQGERVQKLDIFANDQMKKALMSGGECCLIASEEDEFVVPINNDISESAKYVVCMDPLDGSSNIDVNVSIGTIFGIYKRTSPISQEANINDAMQHGTELVAAGYVVYGSSTMLVYSTGEEVNGFTLEPSIGEFCLSHPNMRIPHKGDTFSVNEGKYSQFSDEVKAFIDYCKEEDEETGRPYQARYIGSMVADLHRILLKGGIFFYPALKSAPNGKLRLLYECNPLAFIIENAGGKASTGSKRILELEVTELHQRTPIFIGCEGLVTEAENYMKNIAVNL